MENVSARKIETSQREVQRAIAADVDMVIRQTDWTRVYRNVKSLPRRISWCGLVASVSFSLWGSAGLTLIPFYEASEKLPGWVIPTYWTVSIGALLLLRLA